MQLKNKPLLFSTAIFMSIIGSSLALIAFLLAAFFFKQAVPIVEKYTNSISMNSTSPAYFGILAGLYALSLTGVFMMMNLKKKGFYLYLIGQIILLGLPVFWFDSVVFSVTNTIFSLIFILIYLSFLKRLNGQLLSQKNSQQ